MLSVYIPVCGNSFEGACHICLSGKIDDTASHCIQYISKKLPQTWIHRCTYMLCSKITFQILYLFSILVELCLSTVFDNQFQNTCYILNVQWVECGVYACDSHSAM